MRRLIRCNNPQISSRCLLLNKIEIRINFKLCLMLKYSIDLVNKLTLGQNLKVFLIKNRAIIAKN